jgi:hypothetical protein
VQQAPTLVEALQQRRDGTGRYLNNLLMRAVARLLRPATRLVDPDDDVDCCSSSEAISLLSAPIRPITRHGSSSIHL